MLTRRGVDTRAQERHDQIRKAHSSRYGVYMRSSCSEKWPHNEKSQQIRDKCEKADESVSVSNVLSVTPVSTPDITYTNVYCAICNYHVNEYVYWKAGLYCDDGTNGGARTVTLRKAENCILAYFEQPTVTPRLLDPLRPCIAGKFVDECRPYNQLQPMMSRSEYNRTAKQCGSYADFLYDYARRGQRRIFKNTHCALCNGADIVSLKCLDFHMSTDHPTDPATTSMSTDHPTYPATTYMSTDHPVDDPIGFPFTSFVALLDFSDSEETTHKLICSITESCVEGQVYNHERSECQNLTCPANFELSEDGCRPTKPETVSLDFEIILSTNTTTEKLNEIANDINFKNELIAALQPHAVNGTVQQLNISLITQNSTLYIRLVMTVLNYNYAVIGFRAQWNNISLRFYYNGVLLQSSAITVQIEEPTPAIGLNCATYIALNESEYQMLDNKSLLLTTTNTILHQRIYIISNGSLLRCNIFNQTFNRTVTVSSATWAYDTVLIILSVAGSGILLLTCISLLITYALFKELRTLPGKCIMSYTGAMAMSQILFLFGSRLTNNNTVCTAMGFCLHFFILCQFTWSNVLATDLCRTFVLTKRIRPPQRDSTFLIYNLYAWGAPFIVCLIAVILDQRTNVNIDYASDRICWLQPGRALFVAFVVPVAVILVYNFLAFITLTVSIYRTSKAGSMAHSEMTENQRTMSRIRQQLKIFLGAFSLLGLSWIPAFLAAIDELEWLWYVFMIATIVQGIFLFGVFVLNQKVRGLYAKICKKKSAAKQKTSDGQLREARLRMATIIVNQEPAVQSMDSSVDVTGQKAMVQESCA